MGNKQGANTITPDPQGQKIKEAKNKDERKKEREEKERRKREEKQRKRKKGGKQSHRDDDLDGSSHMTAGDDSESGVFHSAENVSGSPYLDARTVSEMEQLSEAGARVASSTWSSSSGGTYEPHSPFSQDPPPRPQRSQHFLQQHPMILSSSRDFRDGFSLEACIPPEIARSSDRSQRRAYMDDVDINPRTRDTDSSYQSAPKAPHSYEPSGASAYVGSSVDGYSTPLAATPVLARAKYGEADTSIDNKHTLRTDLDSCMNVSATSSSSKSSFNIFTHPFFHKGSHKADFYESSHQDPRHQPEQHDHPMDQKPSHVSADHHPFAPDYRNLPKPSSPHPSRRALSPKMKSTPKKLISSDDSSSSPTTPTPHRRAANIFNIFKPGAFKKDKSKEKDKAGKSPENNQHQPQFTVQCSLDSPGSPDADAGLSSSSDTKQTKPRWKTWERSSTPKKTPEKTKRLSIFGTSRKAESNKKARESWRSVDVVRPSSSRDHTSSSRSTPSFSNTPLSAEAVARAIATTTTSEPTPFFNQTHDNTESAFVDQLPPHIPAGVSHDSQKPPAQVPVSSSTLTRRLKLAMSGVGNKTSRTSSRSSDSNLDSRTITPSASGYGSMKRASSSPPTTKSAAFCIMKLEELERAIEKTIREKFPDAEPFILRKPSFSTNGEEEAKGSRSLPTTPSLKKKRYVVRDETDSNNESGRTSRNNGSSNSSGDGSSNGVFTKTNEKSQRPLDSKFLSPVIKDATSAMSKSDTAGMSRDRSESRVHRLRSTDNQAVMYESVPSPTMSPVILRRFGAQTRHASISPKVVRAKTAVLYNSPSEMKNIEEISPQAGQDGNQVPYPLSVASTSSKPPHTVSSSPSACGGRKVSSPSPLGRAGRQDSYLGTTSLARSKASSSSNSDVNTIDLKPLSSAQKSNSKYDNVMDDEDIPVYAAMKKKSPPLSASSRHSRSAMPANQCPNGRRLVRQRHTEGDDQDRLHSGKMDRNILQEKSKTHVKETLYAAENKGRGENQHEKWKSDEYGKRGDDRSEIEEISKSTDVNQQSSNNKPVIVPTFSAVFGSISPKLKRKMKAETKDKRGEAGGSNYDNYPINIDASIKHEVQSPQSTPQPIITSGFTGMPSCQNTAVEQTSQNVVASRRQPLLKSESVDNSHTQNQLRLCEQRGMELKRLNFGSAKLSPTFTSTGTAMVPPQQLSPTNKLKITTTPLVKPPSDSVSAMSVRERIRSLNKSVSEGWGISEPISPTSPTSSHSTVHSPSPSSTVVTSGPYPYPHFSSERGGKALMSDAPSINKPRPSSSLTPATRTQGTGFCKLQVPQPRPDFVVESATTLGLTSPRSGRKHSTDHVVFGSAVALPCRVYAQKTSPTSPPAPISPLSPREQWQEKRCEQGAKTTAPIFAVHEGNLDSSRGDQTGAKYASKTKEQVITLGNYGATGKELEKVKNEQVLQRRQPSNERKGQCANHQSGDQKNSNTPNVEGPIMTNAPSTHGESCATRSDSEKVVQKGTSLQQVTTSGVRDKRETVLTGQISSKTSPITKIQAVVRTSVNTSASCVPFHTVSALQSSPGSDVVFSSHSQRGNVHTSSTEGASVKTIQNYGNTEVGRDVSSTSELSMKGQMSKSSCDSHKDLRTHDSSLLSYGEQSRFEADKSQRKQQQQYQGKGEKKTDKNVEQENVESPDVYKPKLKNAEEDTKCSRRQPISKVISDMISGENELSHTSKEQPNVSLNEQQPQRQRRRRAQPPEHHLQRQQKLQQQFQQQKPVAIVTETTQVSEERDLDSQIMESSYRSEKDNYLEITIPPRPIVISAISITRSMTSSDLEKSLTAEEISGSKQTQPITHVTPKVQCESREIQTDIITKADKAIGGGFSKGLENVGSPPQRNQETAYEECQQENYEQGLLKGLPHAQGTQTRQFVRQEDKADSETEFLEKIRSSMMPKGLGRVESVGSQHETCKQTTSRDDEERFQANRTGIKDRPRNVPPPSPTAMELLMQEMDEEESDEESERGEDVDRTMKTDSEMQSFSDKVYKRLSDLLCQESEEDISELGSEYDCSAAARESEGFGDMEQAAQFSGLSHSLKESYHEISPSLREAPHGKDLNQKRTRGRLDGKMKETSEADSDDMRNSALERTPRGFESPVLGGSYYRDESDTSLYQHHKTTRVLTIESSSSLTTTTESESEVEETPPVIVFKPPPSEHSTELRRLRDYREDPELPTLLRKAIISRNLGADLWDDDERSKTKSPIARDSPRPITDTKTQLIPEQCPVEVEEEIVVMRQQQQQCQAPGPQQHLSQMQQRRSSREYHSDDDVVAGRGVPDYYDDSTLWTTRRQPGRPPVQFSQLSLAVVAQRRRERRERWLKKRRRNRTDLLSSTGGSSDTDREHPDNVRPAAGKESKTYQNSSQRDPPCSTNHVPNIIIRNRRLVSGSSLDAFHDDPDDMTETHDMGSGILVSPKYSKPIIPSFLRTGNGGVPHEKQDVAEGEDRGVSRLAADFTAPRGDHRSYDMGQSTSNPETPTYVSHDPLSAPISSATGNPLCSGIPGIEETFHELKSVQNILEGLQDRSGAACLDTKPPAKPSHRQLRDSNPSLLHPLTKENLRSLRDCDKTGSNRRSRMSLADRTESDLDLYSERGHDDEDGSSGSEYADDEGEDDNDLDDEQTSYATADDELDDSSSAPGGRPLSYLSPSDTSSCNRKSGLLSDEFDTGTDYLVSCTFYNSNVLQSQTPEVTTPGVVVPASVRQQQQLQQQQEYDLQYQLQYGQHHQEAPTPFDPSPTAEMTPPGVQSLPPEGTRSDARGGTFQSARHQMQDIQSHLQALRRQMAVFPEDRKNDDDYGRGVHSQKNTKTPKRGNE